METTTVGEKRSGFGMLKSDRKAVPVDLDPAELLARRAARLGLEPRVFVPD